MLDMPRVREVFEASTDFTVGLEEEFAILDPRTLSLDQRFEELRAAAQEDAVLAESVAGELIKSEIEIRSGRGENFADAVARQREARSRLFALAARHDALLGATGHASVEPLAGAARSSTPSTTGACRTALQYVAWRNNTFSLHVHVGVNGRRAGGRACATGCGAVMPELLAISANSPFLDGRDSGLHSARTQIFTKSFPRCGIPDAVRRLAGVRRLHRLPRPDELDRRVHAGLVERAAAPLVRHRRDAHLRRADERGRLHGARRADHGLRRPGGARPRRGRAVRGSRRVA